MAGIRFDQEDTPELLTKTSKPNVKCAEYHHRMPVIIKAEELDFQFNSTADNLQFLIEPVASGIIKITKS